MSAITSRIADFIGELRAAKIRISISESIDAMNAIAAAGFAHSRMREALAIALIKDEADRTAFDAAFNSFFAVPARERGNHADSRTSGQSPASGRGRPGDRISAPDTKPDTREPRESRTSKSSKAESKRSETGTKRNEKPSEAEARAPEESGPDGAGEDSETGESAGEVRSSGLEASRRANLRAAERTPFDRYSDLEYSNARDALGPIARRFRMRMGRRFRIARRDRIDVRRTIRAAMQRGGALIDLRRRGRRPRHVDLVILGDVSGSVRYASELMLELIAGARECFRRVSGFVYVDRLAEAEFEQGHLVMTPALDLYARSDFGRTVLELRTRHGHLLTRTAIVVILGDARNNRRPARADIVRDITRIVRAVIWINPEDPARWNTGDSTYDQYSRVVTGAIGARNLRELESALLMLG
jgi:hypothetical protein